jgi:hypothetical protein
MTTLDELGSFIANAAGLTVGEDCFKGTMPATPDVCAAIAEYGGLSPRYVFGTSGIADDMPRVQVLVRGTVDDYAGPRALAETIYRALSNVANQTLSGTRYLAVTPLQPPYSLLQDDLDRYVVGFNCQIEKALS